MSTAVAVFRIPNLPFHQDHEQFFMTEYDRTHLNYWIPLVKPSRTEAGMRLIPWDRLGEKSPRLFNLCRRSGASSLHSLRDGGTLYISDWSGVHWVEENLEVEDVMEIRRSGGTGPRRFGGLPSPMASDKATYAPPGPRACGNEWSSRSGGSWWMPSSTRG